MKIENVEIIFFMLSVGPEGGFSTTEFSGPQKMVTSPSSS